MDYLIRNTPSGSMSFSTSFSHQSGIAYRISNKKWHLQGGLLFMQNRIGIEIDGKSSIPAKISTINPELSIIRRFRLKNNIEFHWQLGVNIGISLSGNRSIAGQGGYEYTPPDTSSYMWTMNFNATSSKPRFSMQSSIGLSFPINDLLNFELGVGVLTELNKPNQWSFAEKLTHNNQPLANSDFIINTESFNERMIFIKLAVFKNIGLVSKSKKRT